MYTVAELEGSILVGVGSVRCLLRFPPPHPQARTALKPLKLLVTVFQGTGLPCHRCVVSFFIMNLVIRAFRVEGWKGRWIRGRSSQGFRTAQVVSR